MAQCLGRRDLGKHLVLEPLVFDGHIHALQAQHRCAGLHRAWTALVTPVNQATAHNKLRLGEKPIGTTAVAHHAGVKARHPHMAVGIAPNF
jgi:hypothetical protein